MINERYLKESNIDVNNITRGIGTILKEVEIGKDMLMKIIFKILKHIDMKGLSTKAPDISKLAGEDGEYINAIPSGCYGVCSRIQITICLDRDNLSDRLRETVYHAGIYCRYQNRHVIFITSKRDNSVFLKV